MFHRKTEDPNQPADSHDDLVWRLLDAPIDQRRFVLIDALARDEISFEDTADVIQLVCRIDALSQSQRPQPELRPDESGLDPVWKLPISGYVS